MTNYTNINKPSGTAYTAIPKTNTQFVIRAGMATGLMISLTYAKTQTFGNTTYSDISKPNGTSYTNIPKPI